MSEEKKKVSLVTRLFSHKNEGKVRQQLSMCGATYPGQGDCLAGEVGSRKPGQPQACNNPASVQGLSTHYAHPRGGSLAHSKEQEEVIGFFPHFGFPFCYYLKHSLGRKWA